MKSPNQPTDALSMSLPASPCKNINFGQRALFPVSPRNRSSKSFGHHALVSPERSHPFMAQRFVGMDCEMVGIGINGTESALARVSLIDYTGRCMFDTFVRVEDVVTDYRTPISGVSAKDLTSSMAITFGECRKRVKRLILNRILVGHGLKNDLKVLKLTHPWFNTRDTSIYQPYMKLDGFGRLRPRRLKELAFAHLGIRIQQYGLPHDSVDDAAAAMALYRKVQVEWDFAMDCKRRNLVF